MPAAGAAAAAVEAAEAVFRVVGTAALRRCRNPEAIGVHVEQLFGVPLEVISGVRG